MKKILSILKVWLSNLKKNWFSSIINLLLYIIPIIVVKKSISELVEEHFLTFVLILIILFLFSEYIKIKDLINTEEEINTLKCNIETLENEKLELEKYSEDLSMYFENLPSEFLKGVSKYLKLKNSDRISLYILNDDNFEIIGRYSENHKYNKKRRSKYPSNKGYIAKCLENTNGNPYYYIDNLPETDKKKDKKKYIKKIIEDTGMEKEEIEKLSMKSRTYFTRVIKGEKINRNIGVLVVESINKTFNITEIELNEKLEELSIPYMINLLEISSSLKGGVSNGE